MDPCVLTSGVDSEYVLGDLCAYLRTRGWEVHELDFGVWKIPADELLRELSERPTVYITSAHTNFDVRVAEAVLPSFARQYRNYLSPLEIIPRVNPVLSIYVPHDLLSPYGGENLDECRYLDLFDYVLAPVEDRALRATLSATTKVCDAGWIKYTETANPNNGHRPQSTAGLPAVQVFVSSVSHLQERFGIDGIADYLRPLLTPGIRIKLPAWKDMDKVEDALRRVGAAEVVAAQETSARLILAADVVVCNAVSSIHAESVYLGRPTICLLDNEAFTVEDQRRRLSHLPDIYFHDYRQRAPIPQAVLEQIARQSRPRLLKPFRYEFVEELLESAWAGRAEGRERRAA
jgi:hypothetical protein